MVVTEEAAAGALPDPRMAGYTGWLARQASLRAEKAGLAVLPPGRDLRDLDVLGVLADRQLSQARLGDLLEINRTVMISVIDELEAADLAYRERDPADRRRYALHITAQGSAGLQQMRRPVENAESKLTAPLAKAGRRRLHELLRSIIPDLVAALPGPVTGRTGFLLSYSARRLRQRREQALREFGVEPRCVGMLVALDCAQPCTQEKLAGCMCVTSPTIMPGLDDLASAGLILRGRNPADRREHVLRLSEKGQDYLAEALKAEDAAQRGLSRQLGEAETSELNTLLTALLPG